MHHHILIYSILSSLSHSITNVFSTFMLSSFLFKSYKYSTQKSFMPHSLRLRCGASMITTSLSTSSTSISSSPSSSQKLTELRKLLAHEAIDAFIIPSDDPHMSEYTPLYYNRREYASGFTGSAGTAIILKDQAVLFTDGRYHNQASLELDNQHWTLMKQGLNGVPSLMEFLSKSLNPGAVVGIDPWIHNAETVKRLSKVLQDKHISLKLLPCNIVDRVWDHHDRTPLASDPIRIHNLAYAGFDIPKKLALIRADMNSSECHYLVVSSLDEIAWLYNLRGADVPCNPVFVSYALVTADHAYLFIDKKKVGDEVHKMLSNANVTVLPYEDMLLTLKDMISSSSSHNKVFVDPKTINYALYSVIPDIQRYEGESPILAWKGTKNEAELAGMRACHLRDGAAMVEFSAWLNEAYTTASLSIDEYDIDIILTDCRKNMSPPGSFVDRSFPTIAGVDANGAIIHYRANKIGCKTLTSDSMLLLDSGAQYVDGTTDVTRTLHMGQPTSYQREMFTRVLKGHIGIDRSIFPAGTPGCLLDSYAREHLWRVGKDFIHGVGHGVGAALNVHEGPHKISRMLDNHALIPGMIVSNEPGYYEDGNFGIRIENLLIVTEKTDLPEFGGRKFYCFEKLTHIPIEKKLMLRDIMTQDEIAWLNSYHQDVYDKVAPLLKTERAKKWLKDATSAF